MTTLVFDTHSFVKKLTAAGMPEAQAEILATEQANLIENRLATKHDISLVHKDLEQLRKDMLSIKRETINEMTIRFGGMLVVAVGALATILKLFS